MVFLKFNGYIFKEKDINETFKVKYMIFFNFF